MSSRGTTFSSVGAIVGLLVLSALPLTFGVLRLLQLGGISDAMPPLPGGMWLALPVGLHIAGALIYAVLGAFQFSATIRRRWPAWHRLSGRISICGGFLVALSALWLTANYATMTAGGILLACFRLIFAAGLLTSLVRGYAAVRRRNFQHHREWMIRAYALALGAATQMIVLMIAELATGGPASDLGRALLMGLAWTLNLTFAEWIIRRKPTTLERPTLKVPSAGRSRASSQGELP